jgi:hypothetical protein
MALNEVEAVLESADAKKFKDILATRLHISKNIYKTIDSPPKGCVYQAMKSGLSKK